MSRIKNVKNKITIMTLNFSVRKWLKVHKLSVSAAGGHVALYRRLNVCSSLLELTYVRWHRSSSHADDNGRKAIRVLDIFRKSGFGLMMVLS